MLMRGLIRWGLVSVLLLMSEGVRAGFNNNSNLVIHINVVILER